MRKVFLSLLLFIAICQNSFSQGAMIVQDPTSFGQRAVQFAEEMAGMAEQKLSMLEQLAKIKEQGELAKEQASKFKAVANWVKDAREAILIIDDIQKISNQVNMFRDDIFNSNLLNPDEQTMYFSLVWGVYENIDRCVQDVKTYTKDFKEQNENGIESADRKMLLENLRKYTKELRGELSQIRLQVQMVEKQRAQTANGYLILARTCGYSGNVGNKKLSLNDLIEKTTKK